MGVVEILLDKGGDIEAQSERTKDTPLSLACSGGRQEVILQLTLHKISFLNSPKCTMYIALSYFTGGGAVVASWG